MAGTWKKALTEMASDNDDIKLARLALKGGKKLVGTGAYAIHKHKDKNDETTGIGKSSDENDMSATTLSKSLADTPDEKSVSFTSYTLEDLKFTIQCPECGSSSDGDVCRNCGADLKDCVSEKIAIKDV